MRVEVAEAARLAMGDAEAWYEACAPGKGARFLAALRDGFHVIGRQPLAWPVWSDAPVTVPPIRRLTLRRFPNVVAYQAHADHVLIVGVVHGHRMPGTLR